jgi:uncharacterized protein YkwD
MTGFQETILEAINILRISKNLPPLVLDDHLSSRALKHCHKQAKDNKPSHGDVPTFQNVLMGRKNFINKPEKAVEKWTMDEGHLRPMIDPKITRVGVEYFPSDSGDIYITANFD